MIRLSRVVIVVAPALIAACATVPEPAPVAAVPVARLPESALATRVLDRDAAARLIANKGVTLQWLGWNQRGTANVRWEGDRLLLTAAQAKTGGGRLFLDGTVEEVGAKHFTFRGTIRIEDTPDDGRRCEQTKSWHFAVTQNRPYWRLREFEWCDGLTDYVDFYF